MASKDKRPADLPNRLKRPSLPTPPKAALAADKKTKDSVFRRKGKTAPGTPGKARSLSPRARSMESSPSSGGLTTPSSQALGSSPRSGSSKRRTPLDASPGKGVRLRDHSEPAPDEHENRVRFLQEQLLEELETRRQVVAERDLLRAQLADMQSIFQSQSHLLKREYDHHVDDHHQRLHQVQREVNLRDAEMQQLRAQNLELKQAIAGLTRAEEQKTDAYYAERMETLWNSLRNWTVAHYRQEKVDWSSLSPESRSLIRRGSGLEDVSDEACALLWQSDKLSVLLALINSRLKSIWSQHFGIPGDVLGGLESLERQVQSSPTEFAQWRSTTVKMLRAKAPDAVEAHRMELRTSIAQVLDQVTARSSSTAEDETLLALIDDALDIATSADSQRACLSFEQYPWYSSDLADEINADEPSDAGRIMTLFPTLVKRGDTDTSDPLTPASSESTVVIYKAKVLLVPDPDQMEE